MEPDEPRTLLASVSRGFRLRCPRCGIGRLHEGVFKLRPVCAECGLSFRPEQGYYLGAIYINYAATAGLCLAAGFLLVNRVPFPPLMFGLAALAVGFPILFFRQSRGLWRAFDFYFSERNPTK